MHEGVGVFGGPQAAPYSVQPSALFALLQNAEEPSGVVAGGLFVTILAPLGSAGTGWSLGCTGGVACDFPKGTEISTSAAVARKLSLRKSPSTQ